MKNILRAVGEKETRAQPTWSLGSNARVIIRANVAVVY